MSKKINVKEEIMIKKRENCEWFEKITSTCSFYGGEPCFHSADNRCYKLQPRTEEESMPWMGELCSDCNELPCNDCHMYIKYHANEEWKEEV